VLGLVEGEDHERITGSSCPNFNSLVLVHCTMVMQCPKNLCSSVEAGQKHLCFALSTSVACQGGIPLILEVANIRHGTCVRKCGR
jgi:hypothetical protein